MNDQESSISIYRDLLRLAQKWARDGRNPAFTISVMDGKVYVVGTKEGAKKYFARTEQSPFDMGEVYESLLRQRASFNVEEVAYHEWPSHDEEANKRQQS